MHKKLLFLIFGIFLINLVSASINCGTNPSFSKVYNNTNIPSLEISIVHCTGNATPITLSGQGTSYISLADTSIFGEKDIKINIVQGIPVGNYLLSALFYDNGTIIQSIPLSITIQEASQEPTSGCRLIELPHTVTFRLKQGETGASGEIKVKASTECPNLDFNVIEQTQMSKPMFIQSKGESLPGKEYSFTIGLDAKEVNIGSYSNSYIISGSSGDNVYQKAIPLSLIISQGVSAIDNDTFSTFPTCTLDSNMIINSSYKLICQNENPNLGVEVPYHEYFEVTYVNNNAGTSEHTIKPKKIGNAIFMALFKYQGTVIGTPFLKEIRITHSGTAQMGTQLEISFYQGDIKKALSELLPEETLILIKDSLTQNIVSSFTAYLNGKIINTSFILEANKPYEMIIDSPSYLSKTINFTINPQYITISLNPSSGWVEGSFVYYNTTPENASLFLDGIKLTTNNFVPLAGNHTLEAILDGYINTKLNITVLESVRIITPLLEWKKGVQQSMLLSKSASWQINYAKDLASQYNPISSGVGTNISFTPEKSGLYQVIADGKVVDSKEVKGRDWGKKWWFMAWYWWLLLGTGMIIVAILLYRRNSVGVGSNISEGGFRMQGVGGGE